MSVNSQLQKSDLTGLDIEGSQCMFHINNSQGCAFHINVNGLMFIINFCSPCVNLNRRNLK